MGAPAVILAPRVFRIPTFGDLINSYAFVDDDGQVTLVDCGLARAPRRIVDALDFIGKHPSDVTRIALTHAHLDHAGGARALVGRTGADGVAVHVDDADSTRAGRGAPPDLATTAGRILDRLPMGGFAPAPVAMELRDGDVLAVAGGLRVVHTPGHSPGHVSLLHEPTGVLITGDALFNVTGRIRWPLSLVCTSPAQNRRSAHVLADLDYDIAAFTHGPEIRSGAREAIRAFLLSGR